MGQCMYIVCPITNKTEQLFKEQGISNYYKKQLAQLDDELFYKKIANPETEKTYQWEDLPPGYRKFSNGKKYQSERYCKGKSAKVRE
jgi:hypothetical protein